MRYPYEGWEVYVLSSFRFLFVLFLVPGVRLLYIMLQAAEPGRKARQETHQPDTHGNVNICEC